MVTAVAVWLSVLAAPALSLWDSHTWTQQGQQIVLHLGPATVSAPPLADPTWHLLSIPQSPWRSFATVNVRPGQLRLLTSTASRSDSRLPNPGSEFPLEGERFGLWKAVQMQGSTTGRQQLVFEAEQPPSQLDTEREVNVLLATGLGLASLWGFSTTFRWPETYGTLSGKRIASAQWDEKTRERSWRYPLQEANKLFQTDKLKGIKTGEQRKKEDQRAKQEKKLGGQMPKRSKRQKQIKKRGKASELLKPDKASDNEEEEERKNPTPPADGVEEQPPPEVPDRSADLEAHVAELVTDMQLYTEDGPQWAVYPWGVMWGDKVYKAATL